VGELAVRERHLQAEHLVARAPVQGPVRADGLDGERAAQRRLGV
jgi:hypothetical protein